MKLLLSLLIVSMFQIHGQTSKQPLKTIREQLSQGISIAPRGWRLPKQSDLKQQWSEKYWTDKCNKEKEAAKKAATDAIEQIGDVPPTDGAKTDADHKNEGCWKPDFPVHIALGDYNGDGVEDEARILISTTKRGLIGIFAEAGADALGSPQNVFRTIEYAFKVVTDGSSLTKAAAADPPPTEAVVLADPTTGGTAVRMTETISLQNDPDYASVKDEYLARNIVKLVTKTFTKNGAGSVTSAKTEVRYDEQGRSNPDLANAYRGQPTTVRSWLDTNDSWLETHTTYDAYGNAIESTDARGSTTTTTYDSAHHAYPTQVTSPVPSDGTHGSNVAFVTTTVYDTVTGQPTSTTDANGLETRIEYEDPMLRPTRVATYHNNQQVGAASETIYGEGTDSVTRWIKTLSQIDAGAWKESKVWYDGLGRTTKTQSVDAANGDVFVDTQYDNMDRPFKVTNPYRSGETVYWTESIFDTAGRPWKTVTPDGAVVETAYSVAATGGNIGTAVTVTDQAGKQRRSVTNALGHLTRVDEPVPTGLNAGQLGAINTPNQPTFYTYDLLNNLIEVQQPGDNNEECGPSTTTCSQTRSFQYDSLSRLKQATNPESGTIQYTYDANSNLQTKTDARGVKTDYAYDALNRVKTRTYSTPNGTPGTGLLANYQPTPNVGYYYDNLANAKGKLIKVSSTVSITEYTGFDILGRVTSHKQTTDGTEYATGYKYNLAGALVEATYPSGRVVRNTLDSNGDLTAVLGRKSTHPQFWVYANNFKYSAAGAVTRTQLGNGLWESTQFNSRLQPTQIALGSSQNGTDKLRLDYQYGDLDWNGSVIAGTNNGNVAKQTITVAGVGTTPGFTAVQNYDYDPLNRIQIASETLTPTSGTAETWTQEFRYDRYGNRTFHEPTTTTLPKECNNNTEVCVAVRPIVNPSVSPTNNRLNGYTFDVAGNTTHDAENRKFTYDAENKQAKVETLTSQTVTGTVGEYWYDGDGRRVKKRAYVNNGPTEETTFVYDAREKLIGEYSNEVASAQDAKVAYLTNDHLGSPRINTDLNGSVISRHDYRPFGDEVVSSKRDGSIGYADDAIRKQFTGYERDTETQLDFAQARSFAFQLGRFHTVDPFNIIFEKETGKNEEERQKLLNGYLSWPQHWNRHVYVLNNPLKFVDPYGDDVYVVLYTTGNKENEEQFKRAAETKAAAIRKDGRFDSKKDTVLVVGVSTKKEVQTAFDSAKQLESQFGKVAQVQMFSHSGPVNGPVLPGEPKGQNQFTATEMSNLRVNWEKGGQAWFYGCNTAKFAQDFANAQGVTAWGYDKFAYFSNSETSMIPDAGGSRPVYLIGADYGEANGTGGAIRYLTGFGRVYDLKVKNPRVRKY